eukprot:7441591-Ditylum_brightwellii.AAC.1
MIPWPNQAMQPGSYWITWRRFLKKCFAPETKKGHRLHCLITLHQPLGNGQQNTVHRKGILLLNDTRQGIQASPWLLQHLQSHNWPGHLVPNNTSITH